MKAEQLPVIFVASSTLRVIKIDPQTDWRWEAFLRTTPASWIYYHPLWLQIMEEAYGYKPAHLACENTNGQLVGILPLFYQRGLRSGRIFRSVFTGPLASNDSICVALLQAAVKVAHILSGAQLHLKMLSNALDNAVDGLVAVPAYETYHLALAERVESMQMDSTIKRAVNKAARLGVEVRRAQTEAELSAWYELYAQTMRKLVVLPNPFSFYKLAWERLHPLGLLRLLLAEREEAGERRLLGGNLLLLYGKTISFDSSGWREEDQALRVNDLLHWRTIQDACTEGFRWYDFGDVSLSNQGLARYKRKWGAQELLVYDYRFPTDLQLNGMGYQLPDYARSFVRTIWQRLPVKAVEMLGYWYYTLHLY
jgi:hypothetical protein